MYMFVRRITIFHEIKDMHNYENAISKHYKLETGHEFNLISAHSFWIIIYLYYFKNYIAWKELFQSYLYTFVSYFPHPHLKINYLSKYIKSCDNAIFLEWYVLGYTLIINVLNYRTGSKCATNWKHALNWKLVKL